MLSGNDSSTSSAVGIVPSEEDRAALDEVAAWIVGRLAVRDAGLPPTEPDRPLPPITRSGAGTAAAWRTLRDQVVPTAVRSDHPRYLAFVPQAASVAAVAADLVISAAGIYAGGEFDAGIVVAAERAAAVWLADLIGLPAGAHGVFTPGGTVANLSALVAARHVAAGRGLAGPGVILAGAGAHSSVEAAARVMGARLIVDGDSEGRLDTTALDRLASRVPAREIIAVVGTAGATNTGVVDDLAAIADFSAARGLWFHVDAAYGGAAMLSPRARTAFAGIERCDSVTIDPHKWLFAPYDCGAVLYRDPSLAYAAHAQQADYLDVYDQGDNPADYAIGLSRRARGLPLWFSLLANGTDAYRAGIEACLNLAAYAARQVEKIPGLELMREPSLSIVLIRRVGWAESDYSRFADQARASGLGVFAPTRYAGEPALRLCFVNPVTTERDIDRILEGLR
jgi:glutamate/tyrosine decarboxylase-like PLP-dependent enzyme